MLYIFVRAVCIGVMLQLTKELDVLTASLLGPVILSLAWLLWRLWSFTVLPYLRPEEPQDLPYLIPCNAIPTAFFFSG